MKRRSFAELADQLLDVLFDPLALVIENQPRAGCDPRLRNCPGDTALVRNAKNNSHLSFKDCLSHTSPTITAFAAAQKCGALALQRQIAMIYLPRL